MRVATCLGIIDPVTKNPVFNEQFVPWMKANHLPIEKALKKLMEENEKYNFLHLSSNPKVTQSEPIVSPSDSIGKVEDSTLLNIDGVVEELKNSEYKLIGASHLLRNIFDQIGLTPILQKSFPKYWRLLMSVAMFFAVNDEELMYGKFFEDFFDDLSSPEDFTPENINSLFASMTEESIQSFYKKWFKHVKESDFIAFGTNNFTPYSKILANEEFRHPKQETDSLLNHFNVSWLFGEKTGLPIICSDYNGLTNDIQPFIRSVTQHDFLTVDNVKFVLGPRMYTQVNINYMLKVDAKFIVCMSSAIRLKKDLIRTSHRIIDNKNFSVTYLNNNLYGVTRAVFWEDKPYLWAHVFIDPNKCLEYQNQLQESFSQLLKNTVKYPSDPVDDEYLNYITPEELANMVCGTVAMKRKQLLASAIKKVGWSIYLSNYIKDTTQALHVYRQRDIAEKACDILKNVTREKNITIRTKSHYSSSLFITFLSLVLLSRVNKVMIEEKLYLRYTLEELFLKLKSVKRIKFKNSIIYQDIPYEVIDIFQKFNCPCPVDSL
ncbi:MAG: hypothetical protein LBE27_03815 [Deltaproteobacteria bacterium]|jgi:transposase|nr:hypothetical protein [Deltaproteobacteria bacterium]